MLHGNFIGIDKLERLKLLQVDPMIFEVHFPGWKDHPNGQKRVAAITFLG